MGSTGYHGIEGMRVVSRPSIGAVRDYEGMIMGPSTRDYDAIHKAVSSKMGPRDQSGVRGTNVKDYETVVRSRNDYEGVMFNSRKDYEHLPYRTGNPPIVAPKPRLSSVSEDISYSYGGEHPPKRPPPPLPPKPVRGPPPLPPHAQHLHNNFGKVQTNPSHGHDISELPMGVTRTKSGVYLGMPGEKGYNVSFV